MINIKKLLIILSTFSILFIAFITGFGFIAIALFAPLIIPFIVSAFKGAVSLFSAKLLLSFTIGIAGAISIVPLYNAFKKMGIWVKGKAKKVKTFFKKRFGKKKDMETQTERHVYDKPESTSQEKVPNYIEF